MKTKLIQTKDYLLLIDEEVEIKEGDIIFNSALNRIETSKNNNGILVTKILAHYPLHSEAKELDLPLLPNPFNKEVDETTLLKNLGHECFLKMKELNPSGGIKEFIRMAVEFGYKAAQSKNFSLEDVKKAFIQGTHWKQKWNKEIEDSINEPDIDKYLKSLSTQQLPKEFIPEYEIDCVKVNCNGECIECNYIEKVLKTITNLEGKQEIQGRYVY